MVKHWTYNQDITGLIPAEMLCNNLEHVVHTFVPSSPSSIIWY